MRDRAGTSNLSAWIAERCPLYARAWVLAGLWLAPLAFHRGTPRPFGVVKVTVVWLTALGGLALTAAWLVVSRRWPPRGRIAAAAGAFLVASIVATAFSISPAVSVFGIYMRPAGLAIRLAYAGIALVVVALYWREPMRLRQLLWAIAAGSTVVAVSVLAQEAGIDRGLWDGPVPNTGFDYPPGVIGNSNFAGAHLGIALPVLCYLLVTARRRSVRALLAAAVVLHVVGLWFTQSRGGLLAGGVGVVAMVLFQRERLTRALRAGVVVVACLAVVAFGLVARQVRSGESARRLGGAEVLRTASLGVRLSYWEAAGRSFLDNPLAGTGLNTFYSTYPRYRPSNPETDSDTGIYSDKAHNIYLEHAADGGLLLIGTYLLLIGLVLVYALRRRRQLAGPERLLLGCFVGAFAAYLAQGLVSIDMPNLGLLSWVAMAAIAVLADPAIVSAREGLASAGASPRRSRAKAEDAVPATGSGPSALRLWATLATILLVTASAGVLTLRPLRAEVVAKRYGPLAAIKLNPFDVGYRLEAGRRAELAGRAQHDPPSRVRYLSEARAAYNSALALQPGSVEYMLLLARLETVWGTVEPDHFADAETWWRRVLIADPQNQALRATYADEIRLVKARAVEGFEAAARRKPEDVSSWINLAKAQLALGNRSGARDALVRALSLDLTNREALRLLRMANSPR